MNLQNLIPKLLILIIIKAPWTNSEGFYGTCNPSFNCGSISGFHYPFRRHQDPAQCGYPGFELNCDQQNPPTINIMNITYRVLSLNPTAQTLKLVRGDMVNSACPQDLVNTTIDHELFDYTSSYTNISFLFGCPIPFDVVGMMGPLSCDGSNLAILVPGTLGPGMCNTSVTIPFPVGLLNENPFGSLTWLVPIFRDGFEVRWKVEPGPCTDCTLSGGQCVYDISRLGTTCACPEPPLLGDSCLKFVCGSLRLIKYPFWGANRPNYCGKIAYKLNCDNDVPLIEIMSLNYRIIDFDYQAHTITVARTDYWGEICPSRLVNTTIDFTSFNYTSGTRNLTLGYGCPLNVSHALGLEYSCNINKTKTNVTYDPSMSCSQTVVVPAFGNVASDLDQNRTSLVDALGKGFGLKWFVTDVESEQCRKCIISGGSCGVNPNNDSFICYCYNGPYVGACHKRPGIVFVLLLLRFKYVPSSFPLKPPRVRTTMKPHLNPSLIAITIVLATVTHLPLFLSQKTRPYDVCRQSVKCGNIKLEYPFWGSGRPSYCGHPGFQLTCQSNVPELVYESVNYRVLESDSSTQTITVARNDLWANDCPQYLHNTTYNSTIFNGDNFDQQNVSLYYKCDSSIPGGIPMPAGHRFSCNVNNTQSDSYFYVTNLISPNIAGFFVLCDNYITVPVNQSSAGRLAAAGASRSDLSSALTAGFELQWMANNQECDRCIRSDGQCGSNSTSPDLFACHCAGGSFSVTCNNVDGGGKWLYDMVDLYSALPIVGAVIVGVGIGWGIFVCRQRRKRLAINGSSPTQTESKAILTKYSTKVPNSNDSKFTSSIPPYPSPRTSETSKEFGKSSYFGAQVFTYEELAVATDNFNDSRELGDGGFGAVYYGKLLDGREVAVKRLYENSFRRVEQYMNEVRILTGLDHENLVKLYGCTSKQSKDLLLVYEYVSNGTVGDHLHGKLAKSSTSLFSWPVRFSIAIQTADALAYLHQSGIIHRDVKTNNILLDKSFQVKVADFGLSRLFQNVTHVSTAPQGTPGYVDPEYYQCYHLTDKSDVYSFGVVLIELISSLQAVDTNRHRLDINLANMAMTKIQNHMLDELVDKSIGFERNGVVRRTTALVAELAFRCLQQQKDMRPTMKEVAETLRGIRNDDLNAQKPEVVDVVVDDGGHNT
ncbi:hypothetical protein E3N88_20462 [Mikania micrantha]|uniref:non-specific serine/threonine protein kinase n=1 Tax=Mikania micrantha TaxID=192012 RepID=A0A5N6NI87_9ASTR|nr:hypothetical protein E3N88_20462 [Mikania micrantha]